VLLARQQQVLFGGGQKRQQQPLKQSSGRNWNVWTRKGLDASTSSSFANKVISTTKKSGLLSNHAKRELSYRHPIASRGLVQVGNAMYTKSRKGNKLFRASSTTGAASSTGIGIAKNPKSPKAKAQASKQPSAPSRAGKSDHYVRSQHGKSLHLVKAASQERHVLINGIKYQVEGDGRRLLRVASAPAPAPPVGHLLFDKETSSSITKHGGTTYVPRFINVGGATYTKTSNGFALHRSEGDVIRAVASRKVKQSISKARRRNIEEKKKADVKDYCRYFNLYGKCSKPLCPYIHDPDKVAVCRAFLQGKCIAVKCPLLHKIDQDKMPTCYHFLRGSCSHEKCPYSHVNVNRKAMVCPAFLDGYCPDGASCTKKHVLSLSCPDYVKGGKSPRGENCNSYHPPSRKRSRSRAVQSANVSRKKRHMGANGGEGQEMADANQEMAGQVPMPITGMLLDTDTSSEMEVAPLTGGSRLSFLKSSIRPNFSAM